ncbi:hypothetical protein GGG16DRAFT_59652 [Schizophyllum commune]
MSGSYPKPLLRVPITPKTVKRSSLPQVANLTARDPTHAFNTKSLGYHDYMKRIFAHELESPGGTSIVDPEVLADILFPKEAFAVPVEELLESYTAAGLYDGRKKCWPGAPKLSGRAHEYEVSKWLEKLRLHALSVLTKKGEKRPEGRVWTSAFCNNTLPGGVTDRKPDILELSPEDEETWQSVLSDLQHKASKNNYMDAAQQLHDGGLNSLSSQDNRVYHIGLGMAGPKSFAAYYDRSGCIRSSLIDVHKQPLIFLRIFLGLSLADRRWLGFDTSIRTEPDSEDRFVTVAGIEYRILSRINDHESIRGSGTVVWLCEPVKRPGTVAVIKNAWVDTSRPYLEADFLLEAQDKKVHGVPRIIAHEIVKDADGRSLSTLNIRKDVCDAEDLAKAEERVYVRFVMDDYGSPLGSFKSKAELLSGFTDSVEAHMELLDKCEVIHGDVHDKNILLNNKRFTVGGLRRGLLADLGDGVKVGFEGLMVSKGLKSCPAFFMACDLLTCEKYLLPEPHHDLESFLYVLIWTCTVYDGPEGQIRHKDKFDLMKSRLGRWLSDDMEAVGFAKDRVMGIRPEKTDLFVTFLDEVISPYFEDFKLLIVQLRMVVMRTDPRPTHQEVLDILRPHLDSQLAAEEEKRAQEAPQVSTAAQLDDDGDVFGEEPDNVQTGTDDGSGGVAQDFHQDDLEGNARDEQWIEPTAEQEAGSSEGADSAEGAGPAEHASGTRKSKRKRGAHDESGPTDSLYRDTCTCFKKVEEGEEGVIRCRSSRCTTIFYHYHCVKKSVRGPRSIWVCEHCKTIGFKMAKTEGSSDDDDDTD